MSLIIALGVGFFFFLYSLFSKKEDFLLDDYTEDDKPDNVRIIEREIPKIIEKEIIKEVEKIVIDTEKIKELEEKINDIENSKKLLEQSLKSTSDDLEKSEERCKKIEQKLNEYKVEKELVENDFTLYKKEMSEKFNLVTEEKENIKKTKDKDYTILQQSIKDQQQETNNIISKLKEEKVQLLEENKKIEENRNEYQKLYKETKKELDDQKKEINSIISDRDHFSNLIDKKDDEIKKLKVNLDVELKKQGVYKGVDSYGHFYNINNIEGKIPKSHIFKILKAHDELDKNQFAYYTITKVNDYENIKINDIDKLEDFQLRARNENIKSKYTLYVIIGDKVYYDFY